MIGKLIKIVITLLFLIIFGIAGEMDYQDHIDNQIKEIQY